MILPDGADRKKNSGSNPEHETDKGAARIG